MLAQFSRWFLKRLGWSVNADFPVSEKYVLVVAPHTSNWDFPLGYLAKMALNMDVRWMGKHTMFRWPLGWFFRAIGGLPVDRGRALNMIDQMAYLFTRTDRLILALAPEGTRAKMDHWKSGFYHIARAANVPIVLAYLDYGKKEVGLGGAFHPGVDIRETFSRIRDFYRDRRGKFPNQESLIQIRETRSGPVN